jgi:tetratricopeptide (TPR) repeat protein
MEAANKYFKQARMLDSSGQLENALNKCRMAIRVCPELSTDAYNLMADILADHGKWSQAADALTSALTKNQAQEGKTASAEIHYKLGVVMKMLGDTKEASKHLGSAIETLKTEIDDEGGSAEKFWLLGQFQAENSNMKEAAGNFVKALALEPNEIKYHLTLADALIFQKQYDEALRRLDESIRYMQNAGRSSDVEKLK